MKKWENLEESLRLEINTGVTEAPSFVWDNIESALDQNNKRRPLFWILGAGLCLLTGLFLTYSTLSETASQEQNDAVVIHPDLVEPNPSNKNTVTALTTPTDESNTADSGLIRELKTANTKTATNRLVSEKKKERKKKPTPELTNQSDTPDLELRKKEILPKASVSEKLSLLRSEALEKEANSSPVKVLLEKERAALPLLNIEVKGGTEVLRLSDKVNCPTFSNKIKKTPFVEINGLLGRPIKTLSSSDVSSQELLDARNDSENSWYAWGGNIAAGLYFNRNLYAGAGLEWSQSKEKFDFTQESLVKMIITFDPVTSLPIDTSFVSGNLIEKGEIRYSSLDLPLFVGYQKSFKKWEIGIEGALLFNLNFKVEGKIFNKSLDIERVETASTETYKNNVGLSYRASVVFRRFFGNGYSFHVKPTYRRFANQIQQVDYELQTKMSQVRIDFGVRKDF